MKQFPRLEQFKTTADSFSSYLSEFRYDVDYFTHWPNQDRKTLRSIVSTRIKLIVHFSGECDLMTQNAKFSFLPNSLFVIPPYTVYSAAMYDKVDSYEIFFNIHPIISEREFLHSLGLDQPQIFPHLLTATDAALLRENFDDVQHGREGAYAQLQAILSMLLIRIDHAQGGQHSVSHGGSREHAVVEDFFTYLNQHIHEPIRIAQVCQDMQISQSYLYRCCKSVMNCSSNQLITRQKMIHAKMLLKNPALTITEVAEAVGYDPYYFSNQFKRTFLISPSDYRKNQK